MKKSILLALLMSLCLWATAAPLGTNASLTGKVIDAIDNSPLVGVTIYIPELSEGTTTDANGNYALHD